MILSHILYSTGNLDASPELVFNTETGDAHWIKKYYNELPIQPMHVGYPEYTGSKAAGSYRLLRLTGPTPLIRMMGYIKFFKDFPTFSNYQNFNIDIASNSEIHFIEYLTYYYYSNVYIDTDAEFVYSLDDYFHKDFTILNLVAERVGWKCDDHRAEQFHKEVMKANEKHLMWYETFLRVLDDSMNEIHNDVMLSPCEVSMIISEFCIRSNIDPHYLNWDEFNANQSKLNDNSLLIKIMNNIDGYVTGSNNDISTF